jgi:diguanylate cyclase (GGDEF)-like protein
VLAATDPASTGTTIALRDGQRGPATLSAQGSGEDDRVIDLLQPIRDADANVVGVIAARLPWSAIRKIERAVVTPDSDGVLRRESFLVSAQDSVLLGPPGSIGRILPLAVTARARAGFYGWSVEPWPANDGHGVVQYLTGAAFAAGEGPSPGAGTQGMRWAVLVREAEDAAFAPATRLRQTIWLVGAIIAASFALAGWLVAGVATRPLAGIAIAAERLRQGDDVEIPRRRAPAEIDSLSASLRALVATLTRKQLALNEMEELALHDPLTGLLNRHGLRANLAVMVAIARERRNSLIVFVGDLDGFKTVNDTLGHGAGDQLLCQVARRLKQSLREQDIVARVGGDEFVIAMLAPGGPHDEASMAVVRRVQAAVTAPYHIGQHDLQVGCSLGGACWPDHVQSSGTDGGLTGELEQVLQLADIELYIVKRSGKGRVQLRGAVPSLA